MFRFMASAFGRAGLSCLLRCPPPIAHLALPHGLAGPSCRRSSAFGTSAFRCDPPASSSGADFRPCNPAPCSGLNFQRRDVFGVAAKKVNLQIHTHDKYKIVNPQPTYDWMVGRFIKDRNGIIWHKQANRSHGRYGKSASQLTRLKRLKPLSPAFARKLKKLGFRCAGVKKIRKLNKLGLILHHLSPFGRKYWMDPDPRMVPGFHAKGRPFRPRSRHDATPDLRPGLGDPALRPH